MTGAGADQQPPDHRGRRDDEDARDENPGDTIGSRWAEALPPRARSTSRTMPANWVSGPTSAASITKRPLSTIVPPTTLAPAATSIGAASPVD